MARKTRVRAIIQMLNLAVAELDAARAENDPVRVEERLSLANRMLVDALAALGRMEVASA